MGGTVQSRFILQEDASEEDRLRNLQHQVVTNEHLLSRIFEYVLIKPKDKLTYLNPAPSHLSAKKAATLRLVCRQWNQEVHSLFLRNRQPLLHLHWHKAQLFGMRQQDVVQCFLSNYQGQLPSFRLTLDDNILDWITNSDQLISVLETIFFKCGGAEGLVQLFLKEDHNWPRINDTLQNLLPAKLPAMLEFAMLDKVICGFFPIREDHLQARVTTFLQQVLNKSPNLREFTMRAFVWPAAPQLQFPATLTVLNTVDVLLPTENNAPMNQLVKLCVDGVYPEEELLRLLMQCRHSLKELILCNIYRPSDMHLDLAHFPVMTKLTTMKVIGSQVRCENPLGMRASCQVLERFPVLEMFQKEVFIQDGVADPGVAEELQEEGVVVVDVVDQEMLWFRRMMAFVNGLHYLLCAGIFCNLVETYLQNFWESGNDRGNEDEGSSVIEQNLTNFFISEARRV